MYHNIARKDYYAQYVFHYEIAKIPKTSVFKLIGQFWYSKSTVQIEIDKFKMTSTMSAKTVINMFSLQINIFFKHVKHT